VNGRCLSGKSRRAVAMLLVLLAAGMCLAALAQPALRASGAPAPAAAKAGASALRLAMVWDWNAPNANAWKAFLDANGFQVHLVHRAALTTTVWAPYAAILIERDSGSDGWADAAQVAAMNASGKPILGLSTGGLKLFDRLSPAIGWGHSMGISDCRIRPVFHTPNEITLPPDGVLALCASAPGYMRGVRINTPTADMLLVAVADRWAGYYPVIRQTQRFVLWGFGDAPDEMSETGRLLMLNVVNLTLSSSTPGRPHAVFLPLMRKP